MTTVPVIPPTVQVQVIVPWSSLVPSECNTCRSASVKVPVRAPDSAPVAFAVMMVLPSALRAPVGVMLVNTKVPLAEVGAVAAAGNARSMVTAIAAIDALAARPR